MTELLLKIQMLAILPLLYKQLSSCSPFESYNPLRLIIN